MTCFQGTHCGVMVHCTCTFLPYILTFDRIHVIVTVAIGHSVFYLALETMVHGIVSLN